MGLQLSQGMSYLDVDKGVVDLVCKWVEIIIE